MLTQTPRRFLPFLTPVLVLLVIGTSGFVLLEGWSLFDGIYMTIITLSTVGYAETHDLSQAGRVFTSILILFSMVGIACWTAGITSIIVSGELSGSVRKRKEEKMISQLSGHTIVCGDGLLGRTVVDQLLKQKRDIVYVTQSELEIQHMRRMYPQIPVVEQDPSAELALADANILSAAAVVAALQSDVDNLMIAITCKGLGTDITVYSCAQTSDYASRMFKVGADEVICPNELGGKHVASLIANADA